MKILDRKYIINVEFIEWASQHTGQAKVNFSNLKNGNYPN